jgi:hypothetical protein
MLFRALLIGVSFEPVMVGTMPRILLIALLPIFAISVHMSLIGSLKFQPWRLVLAL